jgi:hypothetical protein
MGLSKQDLRSATTKKDKTESQGEQGLSRMWDRIQGMLMSVV